MYMLTFTEFQKKKRKIHSSSHPQNGSQFLQTAFIQIICTLSADKHQAFTPMTRFE